jgi:chromate reductase
MTAQRNVAVMVGSLRARSYTRLVAQALMERAPPSLSCRFVELGDLPLYNQDLDDFPPAPWVRFRQEIASAEAVLLATPEYNRTIPACLKNALDVGSRPYGKSVWNGKPTAVVSVSPSAMGAFGANHNTRQALVFLNMPVMQQPEAYIGHAAELFDDKGALKKDDAGAFLTSVVTAFEKWIDAVLG